jgi:SAM-dependent methyltransferase
VVGCGGGREAFALEARGYDVVGIDIVEEQIESARSNARHRGSEAIFRAYDGNDMPFPDERFGAVTFWSQVLGNVPGSAGRHRLLREAHRVLEPGGVLSLSVHDRRRSLSLLQDSEVYRYRLLPSAEPGDLVVRGASEHECYWHYFDASELIDLCRDAGFSRVQVQTTGGLGEDWDNVLVAVCEKA